MPTLAGWAGERFVQASRGRLETKRPAPKTPASATRPPASRHPLAGSRRKQRGAVNRSPPSTVLGYAWSYPLPVCCRHVSVAKDCSGVFHAVIPDFLPGTGGLSREPRGRAEQLDATRTRERLLATRAPPRRKSWPLACATSPRVSALAATAGARRGPCPDTYRVSELGTGLGAGLQVLCLGARASGPRGRGLPPDPTPARWLFRSWARRLPASSEAGARLTRKSHAGAASPASRARPTWRPFPEAPTNTRNAAPEALRKCVPRFPEHFSVLLELCLVHPCPSSPSSLPPFLSLGARRTNAGRPTRPSSSPHDTPTPPPVGHRESAR